MKYFPGPEAFKNLNTDGIRDQFLVDDLFQPDELTLHFVDIDRAIVGSAVPQRGPLELEAAEQLAADFFTQRREIGVLNIGGAGRITVDDTAFTMNNRDGLYIGRGSREVVFESSESDAPARFYLLSYPAHAEYPTAHVAKHDVEPLDLGSDEAANHRLLYKYFHPDGIPTAQLVMGITELVRGSVWNTMPAHTHTRRTEVYMYFDVGEDDVVFHFMGEPQETRSLVVREGQAVLSPGWSIHAGCGTRNYTFCWAMGGENQDFSDMQGVDMKQIR